MDEPKQEQTKTDSKTMPFTININPTVMADFQQMCEEHSTLCPTPAECPHSVDQSIQEMMVQAIQGWMIAKARSYGKNL